MKNKGGIYQIRNKKNGKRYIGRTVNFARRKSQHFSDLRAGRHFNSHLQRAWNKYGESAFVFEELEVLPQSEQERREQWYLDKHLKDLYNTSESAKQPKTRKGQKSSKEHREKISKANKGKPKSEAHRKALSKAQTGLKRSPEAVAKTTKANRGKKRTPETRAKISKSSMGKKGTYGHKGKKHSVEAKAKMSRPVVCEGNVYSSLTEAANALNLSGATAVRYRIKSKNFKEYYYVQQ